MVIAEIFVFSNFYSYFFKLYFFEFFVKVFVRSFCFLPCRPIEARDEHVIFGIWKNGILEKGIFNKKT